MPTVVQPADRQPAYVLHRRPYRESSALVELLTRDFGRVGAVVRGVRRSPRSTLDIEPFSQIGVTWRGRGELVTVSRSETLARRNLTGDALFAGLYINELLVKTLGREEPVTALFDHYEAVIGSLAQARTAAVDGAAVVPSPGELGRASHMEPALRTFERRLLDELGYGIAFDLDLASGRPIERDKQYRIVDGEGFTEAGAKTDASPELLFSGRQIAAMDAGDYDDRAVRQAAKMILRRAIALRLNGKPLNTRSLFAGNGNPRQRTRQVVGVADERRENA